MSDRHPHEDRVQDGIGGGFGHLNVDDSKVTIIRHPDNKHLDDPQPSEDPPKDAA